MAVDLVKDTVTNIIADKVKKNIKKSIKAGKGNPLTPERIGVMIGKKYLARKNRPKRTREQKIAARAGLAGKIFGKGTFKLASAINSIGKK